MSLAFDFTLDPKSAYEGMILSGRRVFRGPSRWLLFALFAVQSVVIPLGFIGVYFLAAIFITGKVPEGLLGVIIFALIGSGFGSLVNRVVYSKIAQLVCRSDFGRGGRMSFDASGLTLTTDNSNWRTGWQDVEEVLVGKRSLSISISGIVLILPLSAFESKEASQQAYDDVNALFEQARARV